jgi:mannose-6-phosphate isomerase-like protein (cupin superfamily)
MNRETYVSVHDEPMHRFRFRNDFAWVYDVLIPPAAVTLYHSHDEDTFYVAVAGAHVCNQPLGQEAQIGDVEKGTVMVMPHRTKPLIHQVTNKGSEDMRLIGAEILASPPVTAERPLSADGVALIAEKARVRSYDLRLAPGDTTGDMDCQFSGLLVVLSGGALEIAGDAGCRTFSLSPGDVVWHDGPLRQRLTNVGKTPFEAVLGEWR